jgi:carbon-monoxide dehydrogenase large subunit
MSLLGQPLPRVEDRRLLTGGAEFVDDIRLPGALEVAFLRSPVAHGEIVRLDASRARVLEGVRAVVTGRELPLGPLHPPLDNPDAYSPPRPLLASDVVRFVGEPIAVVVAASRYVAEDALEEIELEIEPREALADTGRALEDGAPRLHDHPTNVIFDHRVEGGDVERAFVEADVVVERVFRNPRYCATPIEPRGALAIPEGDGVCLWSSTQAPYRVRYALSTVLRLPPELCRVRCPDVGGGFGQKAHVYPEEILVAWLARELCLPVKWIEDRSENLLAASHARDQEVRVRAAASANGRLLAVDADVVCDTGAYGVFPQGHLLEPAGTPGMIPGPYKLESYRARGRAVTTNKAPEGAYRGVGLPVSAFVHERLMDILAGEAGLDRAEIRRRNFVPPDEFPYTSVTHHRYDSGRYADALDAALEAIGYESFAREQEAARADGRLLGLGISSYVEFTGINSKVFARRGVVGIPGYDGAHVTLGSDGTARLWTTLPSMGQGLSTTFAQLVAEELGLRFEDVVVARPDTSVGGLEGTGTFASRSAIAGGGAIRAACAVVRERLLEDAAGRLEVAAADLEIVEGSVRVVGASERALGVADLAAAAGEGRYEASERFDPPEICYPYATHACVVEVDAETGRVELLRYVVAEDCGTVINPLVVEGQTHGATAQGIGGTLYEAISYDEDGNLVNASLMDYLVPTAAEIPDFDVRHLETPSPDSPYGVKGAGEGGTLAPPGAIANAVSNALAVELNDLPLTPERVRCAAAASPVTVTGPRPGDSHRAMSMTDRGDSHRAPPKEG